MLKTFAKFNASCHSINFTVTVIKYLQFQRKVEPELAKTKLQETTQDATVRTQETIVSSNLTLLPPISGSTLVSGGQSTAIPDQLFADDNNHSSAILKDLAMEEETRQELNKRKKKKKDKRWTDRVTDQEGQHTDIADQIFADDNNHNATMVNDMATEDETWEKRKKKKKKRKRRTNRVVDDDSYTADFMENSFSVQGDI